MLLSGQPIRKKRTAGSEAGRVSFNARSNKLSPAVIVVLVAVRVGQRVIAGERRHGERRDSRRNKQRRHESDFDEAKHDAFSFSE
jgi:hypothetical protein